MKDPKLENRYVNDLRRQQEVKHKALYRQFKAFELRREVCEDNSWPLPCDSNFFTEVQDYRVDNEEGREIFASDNAVPSSAKNGSGANEGRDNQRDASHNDVSDPTPKEREYILDSGASFHCIALEDLTTAERAAIEYTDSPLQFSTANGTAISQSRVK